MAPMISYLAVCMLYHTAAQCAYHASAYLGVGCGGAFFCRFTANDRSKLCCCCSAGIFIVQSGKFLDALSNQASLHWWEFLSSPPPPSFHPILACAWSSHFAKAIRKKQIAPRLNISGIDGMCGLAWEDGAQSELCKRR